MPLTWIVVGASTRAHSAARAGPVASSGWRSGTVTRAAPPVADQLQRRIALGDSGSGSRARRPGVPWVTVSPSSASAKMVSRRPGVTRKPRSGLPAAQLSPRVVARTSPRTASTIEATSLSSSGRPICSRTRR